MTKLPKEKALSRKIAPRDKGQPARILCLLSIKQETNHSSAKISSSPKNGSCRPLADILLNILARMPDNASSSSCVRPPSFWCFFNDVADFALLVMMTIPFQGRRSYGLFPYATWMVFTVTPPLHLSSISVYIPAHYAASIGYLGD